MEASESQQRGQSTLFPLMALMKAQGSLAGRKALVFFSEGLSIPPNLEEAYRSAISEANRANVSIYAVDARGLDTGRAARPVAPDARSLRPHQPGPVALRRKPATRDAGRRDELRDGPKARCGPIRRMRCVRSPKRPAARSLRTRTISAPGWSTGCARDLDSYYEIGYMPGSGAADGRFRSVEVKLARQGVTVHSRSGYFALPETDTTPLLPFELPMLSAAAAMPPPHAFEYAAAAFRFDRSPKGIQHTLVVEVPLDHLTFEENRRARTYALRFTAMALVKDQNGPDRAALRASRIRWKGRSIGSPRSSAGGLRFKRQLWLPPGRYTLWTIARDQATERSSVKSVPLDVAEPSSGIRLSDLSVIRTVDPAGGADDLRRGPISDRRHAGGAEPRSADLEGRKRPDFRIPHDLSTRPAPEIPRSRSNSCATAQ